MKRSLFIILLIPFFAFAQSNNSDKYINNDLILTLNGSYLNTIGNFSDIWENGFAGKIGIRKIFNESYMVELRTGYSSLKVSDSLKTKGKDLSIIPIEITGYYNFTETPVKPFFVFVTGVNIMMQDIQLTGDQSAKTMVKTIFKLGTGLSASLTDNIGLEFVVLYNSNFYKTEAMFNAFEYGFGFHYRI